MSVVSSIRRTVVGISIAALPLSGLAVGSGPAQADINSVINVVSNLSDRNFDVVAVAGSQIAPFAEGEVLLLESMVNGVRFVVQEGPPRLATNDANCRGGSQSAPSTEVECFVAVPFTVNPVTLVDFSAVNTDVTVAVQENSPLDVTYYGGSGRDEYYGGPGIDFVYGGAGNDSLFGGLGNDSLFGQAGDDYLEGETGNDQHFGGPGDNLINSEDGEVDSLVDCGGVKPTEGPFVDVRLDTVRNCTGSIPPPPPPSPVPPVDPPAPGDGQVVTVVETTTTTIVTGPTPGTFVMGSPGIAPITVMTLPSVPTVPTVLPTVPISVSTPPPSRLNLSFQPRSTFDVILFSEPVLVGSAVVAEDGSWSFEGPIPPGVEPGAHTLQIVGTGTDGEVLVFNIGIEVSDDVPPATIVIEGTRGSGRQINTVFVEGSTTSLVGSVMTPRYKLPGQREWQIGKARRTVAEDGTFTWQRRTGKKIRVSFTSGETKSNIIVIPSRKNTLAER